MRPESHPCPSIRNSVPARDTVSPTVMACPDSVCDGRCTMLISARASGSGSPNRMSTPPAIISPASGPMSAMVVR